VGGLAPGDPLRSVLCMVRIARLLSSVDPVGVPLSGGPPWAVFPVRLDPVRQSCPLPVSGCPPGCPGGVFLVAVRSIAPPSSGASAS
jgi:hypothetical protein